MGWILRLAETGPDAAESIDLIEIHRSSGLADIANLGLTLSEAKELLARVQQAMAKFGRQVRVVAHRCVRAIEQYASVLPGSASPSVSR